MAKSHKVRGCSKGKGNSPENETSVELVDICWMCLPVCAREMKNTLMSMAFNVLMMLFYQADMYFK